MELYWIQKQDSIVFVEPPKPPASVKYANVTIATKQGYELTFSNTSGIFPLLGNIVNGTSSNAKFTVLKVVGNTITGYYSDTPEFILNEL